MAEPITEVWSDLYQDLRGDSQGSLKKVINIESVRTSIDNILGTAQGERIFLPEFASRLKDILFEPINDYLINRLSQQVKDTIEIWDDRVQVLGVDTNIDADQGYMEITVKFNIRSYGEAFTHTVTVTS